MIHRHIHKRPGLFRRPKWYVCAQCGAVTKNPRWPFWKKV